MDVGKLLTFLIFIIVPIAAMIVYISISGQIFPKECKLDLRGKASHILSSLKVCVDNCWSKHDFGNDIYSDDCYVVSINSTNSLSKNTMEKFLNRPANVKAYFDELESGRKYRLKIRYNSSAPEISIVLECDFLPQIFKTLIACEGKPVASLFDNLLIIGDSNLFIGICGKPPECEPYPEEFLKPFERLLLNTAKFFKGKNSNILMIWEDPYANPENPSRVRLIEKMRSENFVVESLLHDSPLSLDKIENYDQVWLIRPGICDNPSFVDLDGDRVCDYKWSSQEFQVLDSYLKQGGKIVLLTDVNVPSAVNDEILSLVDKNSAFIKTGFCSNKDSNQIFKHEITEGISLYPVRFSTGIESKCVP
jgi:hypothetical protein